ncbi:trigger factor [Buchnera aphidicola]|uniref:Trigger factor n=1 Tax=Buchnera aphidicola (Therioaphis trifolii) TaxID=1241884 RepID=A0A4D6YMY4_9GAMM|nr:trigger factor [Buchnera aphidicola]QCI27294.1 trigger factor [Buchnera aphidicola (Therioaphis trifolii)]
MKFILKNKNNFEKEINITIPLKNIQELKKKEIIKIRKTTNINGFRKNKIPIHIIENKYHEKIKKNIIKNIIYDNLKKIIKIEKLNIINEPKIIIHQYNNNSDFIYSIFIQSIPDIDLNILKKINIKKIKIIINDLDIEYYIHHVINHEISWKKNINQIQKNDKVIINYNIKKKNIFHQLKNNKITLLMNQNKILPQIQQQLLNKKSGDTFLVEINVPIKHPDIKYQGKKIILKIHINKVLSPKKIYSKKKIIKHLQNIFNINHFSDLKIIIKNQLKKEIDNLEYKYLKNQIIKKIIKSKIIKIPKEFLYKKLKKIEKKINKEYIQNKGNIIELKYYNNLKKNILKEIQIDLFMQLIIKKNKINVTKEEIKNYIKNTSQINENFIKEIQIQKNKNHIYNNLYNIILEKKIINYLLNLFFIQNKTYNLKKVIKNFNQ